MSEELHRELEDSWLEQKHDLETEIDKLKAEKRRLQRDKEGHFQDYKIQNNTIANHHKERAEMLELLKDIKNKGWAGNGDHSDAPHLCKSIAEAAQLMIKKLEGEE